VGVAFGVAGLAAGPALGDVNVYSPDGTSRGTLAEIPGVGCISPSGKHLITPGAGLWDNAGSPLASDWASVATGLCVADGFGNVYVGRRLSDSDWSVTKYSVKGKLVRTYAIAPLRTRRGWAIDLAPDECTLYYGGYEAFGTENFGRFNVCTNTQLPGLNNGFVHALRVLPNWQVISVDSPGATRWDPVAQTFQRYSPPYQTETLRQLSLDPDGTSFWVCCGTPSGGGGAVSEVLRFDIDSGAVLSAWTPGPAGPGSAGPLQRGDVLTNGLAVYSPPLLGSAEVVSGVDSNPAGTAQAFRTQSGYSGQLSRLHLYLDASSTASQVVVGLYSETNGRPGTLLGQQTVGALKPGAWNYVDVPAVPVTAGKRYWIAVLGPAGAGTVRFRATPGGGKSETSARTNLTALPAAWATGRTWSTAPISAYGS
jgi:hypothetical protein